jgi:hypothetical protein
MTDGTSQLVGGPLGGTPLRAVRLGGPVAVPVGSAADALLEPSRERAHDRTVRRRRRRRAAHLPDESSGHADRRADAGDADRRSDATHARGRSGGDGRSGHAFRRSGRTRAAHTSRASLRSTSVPPPCLLRPSHPRRPRKRLHAQRRTLRARARADPPRRQQTLSARRPCARPNAVEPRVKAPHQHDWASAARSRPRSWRLVPRRARWLVRLASRRALTRVHRDRPHADQRGQTARRPEPSTELGNSTVRMGGTRERALAESPRDAARRGPRLRRRAADLHPHDRRRQAEDDDPRDGGVVDQRAHGACARLGAALDRHRLERRCRASRSAACAACDGACEAPRAERAGRGAQQARWPQGHDEDARPRLRERRRRREHPRLGDREADARVERRRPAERTPHRTRTPGGSFGDTGSGVVPSPFRALPASGWTEPTKVTKQKPSHKPRGMRLLDELPGTMGLLIGIGIGLGIAAGAVIAVILWR